MNGNFCPYIENHLQTIEGWEAFDIAEKTISQIRDRFPLDCSLQLARELGYDMVVMAELLPEVAIGIREAIEKISKKNNGGREKINSKAASSRRKSN
ncbi:hypothetical protein [Rickettsia endosymbiont of Cardiosporidium cionae]|uniref:hypothetical protein n=1 Tax=Rickettsia endosymbiont of Cardiosporidium cionae TaxID=2777155 RepID=UPI001892DC58|nr:hypothetical protein [Rickettsia endosymbiont of Cardiosporidium cionae]KAF8818080.1 hypothetical protein IHI24_000879 [Rickettsia endosymbiont of Cardiosporidium cionae]